MCWAGLLCWYGRPFHHLLWVLDCQISASNYFSPFQLGRSHLNSTSILTQWEDFLKAKRTKDSNFIIFKFRVDLVRPIINKYKWKTNLSILYNVLANIRLYMTMSHNSWIRYRCVLSRMPVSPRTILETTFYSNKNSSSLISFEFL